MPAPSNLSGATAVELGPTLPASVVQNVHDSGTTYTVWYKYTKQAGDEVVGVWAFGGLGTYEPILEVSLSDTGAPLYLVDPVSHNRPVQFPIADLADGTVVYFKVTTNNGSVTPASLTIAMERAPVVANADLPAGAIIVPDTSNGFWASILDPADGTVVAFRDLINGERKVALPSPVERLLIEDLYNAGLVVYNLAFEEIASIPYAIAGAHPLMCSDGSSTFFVGDPGNLFGTDAFVQRLSSNGVLDATIYTLTGYGDIATIAVNRAGTVLYFATSYLSTEVRRWDLVNDVELSVFLADAAGYHIASDIIVLADDTFLTAKVKDDASENLILHYDSAGTLLHTYDFGADYIGSIVADPNDATVLWVWQLPAGTTGLSTFSKVQISDGTILATFTRQQFQVGVNQADEDTDMERFGHDASGCSTFGILVLPASVQQEAQECVTAPPVVGCWGAHDIDSLRIGLLETGQP